jgi:hypothetical protein
VRLNADQTDLVANGGAPQWQQRTCVGLVGYQLWDLGSGTGDERGSLLTKPGFYPLRIFASR